MIFEMSDGAQIIRVYHLSPETGEYIGMEDITIPPYTGLPAQCTTDEPVQAPDGYIAVFIGAAWSVVENHRGETFYNIETGLPFIITDIGPVPDNLVTISPEGKFMKWDGESWILDIDAKKQADIEQAEELKKSQLNAASAAIAPLQDLIDLDMATDIEKSLLDDWKKYRINIYRIDVNTAPDIIWPELPA